MKPAELLAQVDDLIRTAPEPNWAALVAPETLPWFGRLAAVINQWNSARAVTLPALTQHAQSGLRSAQDQSYRQILILLQEARHDLLIQSGQALATVVNTGETYEYFEGIRKVVSSARSDLYFVDPYLDADFISRYMPSVSSGVTVRLLTGKKLADLLPAVDAFKGQHGTSIQVRVDQNLHDRMLFVDKGSCFQSGASFKDGARNSPTIVSEIVDARSVVLGQYEAKWAAAKVER